MHRWQRFVAALFLVVFVPANVLAALPLVYCISASGHRALEFVSSIPGYSAEYEPAQAAGSAAVDAVAAESPGRDCLDIGIVPTGQILEAASNAKPAFLGSAGGSPQARGPFVKAALAPPAPVGERSKIRAAGCVGNDQLAALRTIVLLN